MMFAKKMPPTFGASKLLMYYIMMQPARNRNKTTLIQIIIVSVKYTNIWLGRYKYSERDTERWKSIDLEQVK